MYLGSRNEPDGFRKKPTALKTINRLPTSSSATTRRKSTADRLAMPNEGFIEKRRVAVPENYISLHFPRGTEGPRSGANDASIRSRTAIIFFMDSHEAWFVLRFPISYGGMAEIHSTVDHILGHASLLSEGLWRQGMDKGHTRATRFAKMIRVAFLILCLQIHLGIGRPRPGQSDKKIRYACMHGCMRWSNVAQNKTLWQSCSDNLVGTVPESLLLCPSRRTETASDIVAEEI